VVKPATVDVATAAGKLWLFLLVFVDDFELGVDNVAFAFAGAFFGATARLRFRSGAGRLALMLACKARR